eukprot:1460843-Rhodomonas_salina.1
MCRHAGCGAGGAKRAERAWWAERARGRGLLALTSPAYAGTAAAAGKVRLVCEREEQEHAD